MTDRVSHHITNVIIYLYFSQYYYIWKRRSSPKFKIYAGMYSRIQRLCLPTLELVINKLISYI